MSINSIIYILSYFNVGIFFVEARSWPRLTIQNLAFVVPEHISALPPLTYPTTKHAQLRGKPESEHLTHLTYYEMLHISGTVFLRFRPCWKLRIALHPSFRSSSVQVVAKPSGHRVSYIECFEAWKCMEIRKVSASQGAGHHQKHSPVLNRTGPRRCFVGDVHFHTFSLVWCFQWFIHVHPTPLFAFFAILCYLALAQSWQNAFSRIGPR